MTLSIWNELIGADIRFIKGEKYTSRIAEAGQEHRETLIMTHGGGGHLETFARNVIPLAKDLHTIGLEILWHGLSDAPEISDNPQAQVADQIIDLMDAMNIDKAWVHGEAYSGSAVSWLARTQPERLKGVIFESGIGMDFKEPSVDFVGLAESVGVPSVRVVGHDELVPALEQALRNTGGPNLISVTVDSGKF